MTPLEALRGLKKAMSEYGTASVQFEDALIDAMEVLEALEIFEDTRSTCGKRGVRND